MTRKDEKRHIVRAAGIMSIATFISRILGYVEDIVLAKFFGATGIADTFFVAFRIPNLLRELFAEGSMSSAFIPVLTEYQTKHGMREAERLVRITFTFILIFVGLICLLGIIFAPTIVTAIAPGFRTMPEKFSLTVMLTRIMFPFLLFISLAALAMGALNTKRIFFPSALAPALMNIVIIIIVLIFAARIKQPILASYLPEGSITYLYYSMRLIQFPIGIFGVAMGMAVLPTLSEHAAKREYEKLSNDFSFALRFLFFITVPAMVGLIALREPIVNILFQRGQFDYAATVGTAQALLFYSLGIWCIVGSRVITVSFYSMQDTKTPVKIAVIALATNVIFSIILMNPLKHSGLALSNSIAAGLNFILLFFFLKKKLKQIDTKKVFIAFSKTILASSVMGIIGGLLLRSNIWQIQGYTLDKVFYLSGTIALCTCLYFFLSYIMKSEEVSYILTMIRQRFGQ